jgi:hypothetical protein
MKEASFLCQWSLRDSRRWASDSSKRALWSLKTRSSLPSTALLILVTFSVPHPVFSGGEHELPFVVVSWHRANSIDTVSWFSTVLCYRWRHGSVIKVISHGLDRLDDLRADHNSCATWGMNRLRPQEHWDRGFQSHSKHRCLCAFTYSG